MEEGQTSCHMVVGLGLGFEPHGVCDALSCLHCQLLEEEDKDSICLTSGRICRAGATPGT